MFWQRLSGLCLPGKLDTPKSKGAAVGGVGGAEPRLSTAQILGLLHRQQSRKEGPRCLQGIEAHTWEWHGRCLSQAARRAGPGWGERRPAGGGGQTLLSAAFDQVDVEANSQSSRRGCNCRLAAWHSSSLGRDARSACHRPQQQRREGMALPSGCDSGERLAARTWALEPASQHVQGRW